MVNIADILRSATDDSPIILDELGAGTDPEEGAALRLVSLSTCLTKVQRSLQRRTIHNLNPSLTQEMMSPMQVWSLMCLVYRRLIVY